MPTIEFWFDFASTYSYLSLMRIENEARRYGVAVAWRPFLLGPIFRAMGMETSPFVLQKEKGAYMWQDVERQCRKLGLAWTKPSSFPRGSVRATRVALVGTERPWIGAFCRGVMTLNFGRDEDIGNADRLSPILHDLGLPAAEVFAEAEREPNKKRLRERVEEARARGVFGAPTFFVGTEMFWGNDRLDDALRCAAGAGS